MEDNSDRKNVLYEKLYKICYKESWTSFEIPVSFRKKNLTNMNINVSVHGYAEDKTIPTIRLHFIDVINSKLFLHFPKSGDPYWGGYQKKFPGTVSQLTRRGLQTIDLRAFEIVLELILPIHLSVHSHRTRKLLNIAFNWEFVPATIQRCFDSFRPVVIPEIQWGKGNSFEILQLSHSTL